MIQPIAPRHSRGRGWVVAHVGTVSADDPLAEWGHFTPRYPTGIGNNALTRASRDIQRETALFWFHLNLVLWDQTRGGPWFGFSDENGSEGTNIAGWDQGAWAPPRYDALSVLTAEFGGGTLPDDLIDGMAVEMPGEWEWLDAPPPVGPGPMPAAEIIAAVRTGLDQMKEALTSLSATPGILGHNGLVPGVTVGEMAAVSKQVDELQEVLDQPALDLEEVRSRWERIWGWVAGLVRPAIKLLAEGFLREAGKDAWDRLHQLFVVWGVGHHVGELLMRLLESIRNSG